jgi:hypothetical protein
MSGGLPGLVRDLSSLNRLFTQTSMSMFCWFGTGKTRMPPERSHVSFRQLRTFRRTRSGQLSAKRRPEQVQQTEHPVSAAILRLV